MINQHHGIEFSPAAAGYFFRKAPRINNCIVRPGKYMKSTGFIYYQRGDSEIGGLAIFACIGLFVWWVIADKGEREGYAKYDDCREIVTLAPDNFQKHYKTFTCSGRKTQSGLIMNGECVHIEYESSLFSSSHICKEAYVYQRKPGRLCNAPAFPYLGYDDKCYPTPQ